MALDQSVLFLILLLIVAVGAGLWILYRKLEGLRERSSALEVGLNETLLKYRVGMERIERAGVLIEEGKVKEAIESLEEVTRSLPGLYVADFFLGKAHMGAGDRDKAAQYLESFLKKAKPYDGRTAQRVEEARKLLEEMRSVPG